MDRATLFHVKHVLSAAAYSELTIDDKKMAQLSRYRDWLASEGVDAGGIGPAEPSRLESRHIADSLLFASCFDHEAREVWDLGTGVGLPGVPLAIALPEVGFRLIDRSRRRIDLLRRAIRILDLENCSAVQGEITALEGEVDVIVSRASLPPEELTPHARRLLAPGGTAVAAGSWHEEPHHAGWTTVEIPPDVLDQPIWLLMMRRA